MGAGRTGVRDSVERVFVDHSRRSVRFFIEATDGVCLLVHSPREDEDRVYVTVESVSGGSSPLLDALRGSVLSLARGASVTPRIPLSCAALLFDGREAVLRLPGVNHVDRD